MPTDKISIEVDFKNYTCPVTKKLFYQPQILTPCGHTVEDEAIPTLKKACPVCRTTFIGSAPDLLRKDQLHQILSSPAHAQKRKDQYFSTTLLHHELRQPVVSGELRAILVSREDSFFKVISEGPNKGLSAAWFLCGSENGREILKSDPDLRSKISAEALSHIIPEGPHKGKSAAACLCSAENGIEILKSDPVLRSKISAEALNYIIPDGPHKGRSAVWFLCGNASGIEVLNSDPVLRSKISAEALNYIIPDGPQKGKSAAACLCCAENGREILNSDPVLRSKISAEALNYIIPDGPQKGKSAAGFLCSAKNGREMLKSDPVLRNKISPEALNYIVSEGKDKGTSALSLLCVSDSGIELLRDDPQLRSKIDPKTLDVPFDGTSEIMKKFKGKSIRDVLSENKAGQELLALINQERKSSAVRGHNLSILFPSFNHARPPALPQTSLPLQSGSFAEAYQGQRLLAPPAPKRSITSNDANNVNDPAQSVLPSQALETEETLDDDYSSDRIKRRRPNTSLS